MSRTVEIACSQTLPSRSPARLPAAGRRPVRAARRRWSRSTSTARTSRAHRWTTRRVQAPPGVATTLYAGAARRASTTGSPRSAELTPRLPAPDVRPELTARLGLHRAADPSGPFPIPGLRPMCSHCHSHLSSPFSLSLSRWHHGSARRRHVCQLRAPIARPSAARSLHHPPPRASVHCDGTETCRLRSIAARSPRRYDEHLAFGCTPSGLEEGTVQRARGRR